MTTIYNKIIYSKVRQLADEKGITISQMEKDLHLAKGNSCKWNDDTIQVRTLKRVADYFGVSIEYFLE